MTDVQKKLRRWFRNRKWHTHDTPTGLGAYIESPVQEGIGYVSGGYYKDGTRIPEEKRWYWHTEYIVGIEVDRFTQDYVDMDIYKRVKYTAGPDYEALTEAWPGQPTVHIKLTRDEVHKLAELMDVCKAEADAIRKRHKHKR